MCISQTDTNKYICSNLTLCLPKNSTFCLEGGKWTQVIEVPSTVSLMMMMPMTINCRSHKLFHDESVLTFREMDQWARVERPRRTSGTVAQLFAVFLLSSFPVTFTVTYCCYHYVHRESLHKLLRHSWVPPFSISFFIAIAEGFPTALFPNVFSDPTFRYCAWENLQRDLDVCSVKLKVSHLVGGRKKGLRPLLTAVLAQTKLAAEELITVPNKKWMCLGGLSEGC